MKFKNSKKATLLVTVLLITMMIFSACQSSSTGDSDSPQSASSDVYKIAVACPLTGDYAQYGGAFKNGTSLKVKEINDSGGVNGKKVELVFMDDKNDPKEATNVAQRLASNEEIIGVVGHFSSTACMAAAPIYQKTGLVEFSPTSSHPDFTKQGTFMFRNINTQEIEGPFVADLAVNVMKGKKIGIIYINNDWGITAKDNFIKSAKELGAEIVAEETFIGGQTKDFTPTLTKINETKPDVLLVAAFYSEAGMIAQQMDQLGYDIPIVGLSSLFNEELLKLARDAVEGLHITTNFFPDDPSEVVQSFISEYKNEYNAIPDQFAAVAYDTMGVMLKALQNGGEDVDRAKLREELAKTKDYPGVTGEIKFNENRDVVKSMKYLKVEDGKFILVK